MPLGVLGIAEQQLADTKSPRVEQPGVFCWLTKDADPRILDQYCSTVWVTRTRAHSKHAQTGGGWESQQTVRVQTVYPPYISTLKGITACLTLPDELDQCVYVWCDCKRVIMEDERTRVELIKAQTVEAYRPSHAEPDSLERQAL